MRLNLVLLEYEFKSIVKEQVFEVHKSRHKCNNYIHYAKLDRICRNKWKSRLDEFEKELNKYFINILD